MNDHPMNDHPVNEHPVNEHPVNEHPVNEHPVTERSGTDRRVAGAWRQDAAEEVARIRVDLAAAAAGATPLAEISSAATDLERVQPLLEQLAAAVASLLGTDLAAVWTTDPDRAQALPSAWVGFDDDDIRPLRVPYGSGSVGRAIVECRTVLIEDVVDAEGYAAWRDAAVAHGVRTVLSVPMLTLGGEAVGALSSYYRAPADPDRRDVALAEVLARQAAEIVERARLHSSSLQLAELEQRRGEQLRALAASALALSAADDVDELLQIVTEAAVSIVGCHQGVTTRLPTGWADALTYVALSETYAAWRGGDVVPQGLGVMEAVVRQNRPLRLTGEQLLAHPEWRGLRAAPGHPPLPDYLAAPLVGRGGGNLGLIQLSDKHDGTAFTVEDEAVLVQLAQMASATVERMEALHGERLARQEAEAAAVAHAVLAEASAVFAERFDPVGIAQALVEVVVPGLAELAYLHVEGEDGSLRLIALHASHARAAETVTELLTGPTVTLLQPTGARLAYLTGLPQRLPRLTPELVGTVVVEPERAQQVLDVVPGSAIAVPLVSRGRTVGVLTLMREAPCTEADVAYALDLGRRAALALDNATRYAFERDLAMTLQRSLLPPRLATGPGCTAAARYLPGAQGTQVGGDWYDAIAVDGGLLLVVGDVMGRGVQAATQMGQLQATVRAYALEGHGPAALLERLDRVVLAADDLQMTTCVVVLLDTERRTAVLASAGHLPPVLVTGDGTASLLELDPGLPLGVGGAVFVEREVGLDPGALLLLYTDGLVEDRGASVDVGLATLLAAAAGPHCSVEQLCDRVLAALGRDGGHDDDTALLAVQLSGPTPALELVLAASWSSASLARHALRDLLRARHDVAELLMTEVVANAVRHAPVADVLVRAEVVDGVLRVEVVDASAGALGPVGDPGPDAESGRGLLLLDALSRSWSSDPVPGGKCVWFELGL